MPDKSKNLYIGQRVKYYGSRSASTHLMAHIRGEMYMRLNITPYITATVTRLDPLSGICLRPDGWPLPEGESPNGFCSAVEGWIKPANGSDEVRGILCAGNGTPLTYEQIHNAIHQPITTAAA